ncbi:MAG: EpsG family protein [Carnobacterium sp.]|uniref:EpsG family protein n=1 Tax=Carnobacterium sp. TaxID=48221 RepID=UPI003C721858
MALYVLVFIILIFLALVEVLKRNTRVSFLTGSLLALMAGFRFSTGYDFESYKKFYESLDNINDVFNGTIDAESGYLLINFLFKSIGFNFYFFILFFSVLSMSLLSYFLYTHTKFPSMFLLYYYSRFFLVRDMGQIRSSLACIILLYAIPYIEKKKPIHFLIIVLTASLFHISALFFIIAYLFNGLFKKLSIQNILVLLSIAIMLGIIIQNPQLYLWAVPGRYISYFTNPNYTNGKWILNPILWMQLAIFAGGILCLRSKDRDEQKKYSLLLKIYFLASLILLAAGDLGTVGGRISTLFATLEVLIVPHLILNLTRNKLLNLILFFGFSFIIFFLIFIVGGTYTQYIPYQTVFWIK